MKRERGHELWERIRAGEIALAELPELNPCGG